MEADVASLAVQVGMLVVTTVLGWALGALREKAKAAKESREAETRERDETREALRLLLYYQLTDLHHIYVEKGCACSAADKEKVREVYETYKGLGGNGVGTQLYGEIMAV